MAKHQFQTEVTQLLNLMIHSLYSNKEIFLRELISNASDALDKLGYLAVSDEAYKSLSYEPKITIRADSDAKTLTIEDNGIGMDENDLINNLGTIAKSGTKSFVEALSGDAKKDSSLIGQFGVGFYSAFMVADKIEVLSRKALDDEAWLWSSEAGADYSIKKSTKPTQGTAITLHLKADESEFLDSWRCEQIIKKYSNHIPFPIYIEKSETDKEGKSSSKLTQANRASALWRMSKSSIKEDEYGEFYKQISHDSNDPLMWIHTKAEGSIEYTTLFYVPKVAPFDLFRVDYQSGIKLYIKRVFITDDDKELMPTYLRFLRGVIDAEDLPLNVSREILQQNRTLASIRKASVKKVLSEFKKLLDSDRAKYEELFRVFGRVLKEGLYADFENRDALLDIMLFKSSKRDTLISLKEYKEAMKEGQKSIYYITGENEAMIKNSPLLEQFGARDFEVLQLSDEVDAVVFPMIPEYDGVPMKSVSHSDIDEEIKESAASAENEAKYAALLVKMREILKDETKDVKLSARLVSAPSCLIYDKNDPDFQMQQMMKQFGQTDLAPIRPILEINPEHEILQKLSASDDQATITDVSYLLLDQAKMQEGMKIDDIGAFAARLNKFIAKTL
jgi:molecular chaperone HtpG